MKNSNSTPVRCAILLAGGEGQRLRSFIQRLRGDTLPKQYVNFIGTRSMLEHTYHRAEKLIGPEHVFTIVSEDHLKHVDVCRQLLRRPQGTVSVHPENKDTGPGLLLPLVHIAKRYPDSIVAVFPSDHFILQEDLFMGYVELAYRAVERDPAQMILLGVDPDKPEPDYGYILPEEEGNSPAPMGLQKVSRFIEKPARGAAQELVQKGGLWNTLVMVFKARTLVGLVQRLLPGLYDSFQPIGEALGAAHEMAVVKATYRQLKPWNISKGLLEILPSRYPLGLSVLTMRGVFWSDWGSEVRIFSDLEKFGYQGRLYVNKIQSAEPMRWERSATAYP